jgi:cell fate regulator YaaT (PSP1 superfamily)
MGNLKNVDKQKKTERKATTSDGEIIKKKVGRPRLNKASEVVKKQKKSIPTASAHDDASFEHVLNDAATCCVDFPVYAWTNGRTCDTKQ